MTVYLVYYSDCKHEGGGTIATYETHEEARAFVERCVQLENRGVELRRKHGRGRLAYADDLFAPDPDEADTWTDGMREYAISEVQTGVEPEWHVRDLERGADEAEVIHIAALMREDDRE